MSILGCWLQVFLLLAKWSPKIQAFAWVTFSSIRDLFFSKCCTLFYLPLPCFYGERNYVSLFLKANGWISVKSVKGNQNSCMSTQAPPKAFLRGILGHYWFNCRSGSNTLGRVRYRINSPLSLAQWHPSSSDCYKSVLGFLMHKVYYYSSLKTKQSGFHFT